MNERHDKDALLLELTQAGAKIKGKDVVCPFHEDKSPSGSVYEKDGIWRYRCHASACGFSGDVYDVRAEVTGQTLKEVLMQANPQTKVKPPRVYPTIEAIEAFVPGVLEQRYSYTNPETRKPDLVVLRYTKDGKKGFWQISPARGGYILKKPPGKLPLYNRTAIRGEDTVVVVEGEKCVHALRTVSVEATTSPGGAEKAILADWTPLAGKNCILWPDNDEPGRNHMQQVEGILKDLDPPCRISRINPNELDLTEKEDAADFVEQLRRLGKSNEEMRAEVLRVAHCARPVGVLDEFHGRIDAIVSGEYVAIDWPWPTLTKLTKALLPGSITILAGSPGASKSFMMLQAALYWYAQGINIALYELEGDKPYHLLRCMAQLTGVSDLTDPDWMHSHSEQVEDLTATYRQPLEGFSRHLWTADNLAVETLEQLAQWVEKQAKQGRRIVCADPITAAARTKKPWEADLEFIKAVKKIATQHGISVVLVTHPQKGEAAPSMHNLAGSAAYERFVETIITLHSHEPEEHSVLGCCGTAPVEHNRTVRIDKARNGPGTGCRLAFEFEKSSLTLLERGLIAKMKK